MDHTLPTPDMGRGEHPGHPGHDHGEVVADFRRRFWVLLVLTLLPSPMIQHWLDIQGCFALAAIGILATFKIMFAA